MAGVSLLLLPALAAPAAAWGEEGDVRVSGFLSLVGGKVLDGSRQTPYNDFECPCFIADWQHMAVYNEDFGLDRESRAGIQLDARLGEAWSARLQAVARATEGSRGASLDVASITYTLAPEWTVQVGRKRLPIYYYSDFQDVGFAYPWVRPPQDLYGWEVGSFNGASLAHNTRWGEWNARASLFYGGEHSGDNVLAGNYFSGRVEVDWHDILGADLELTRDWLNLRLVYIQSHVDTRSSLEGDIFSGETQRIYGLAANIDHGNWLVRSELSFFDRWDFYFKSTAAMLGVGYRVGDFTPMFTYSHYRDDNRFGDPYQENRTLSFSLRYDIDASSALKLQYDRFRDDSTEDFVGDAQLLSIAYDRVF